MKTTVGGLTTCHAMDLELGDKFFHNEIEPWEVISKGEESEGIIEVEAKQPNGYPKTFKFGKFVDLDLTDTAKEQILKVERELLNQCDGPVEEFTVMCRAIQLSRTEEGKIYASEVIAEGLTNALQTLAENNHYLPSNEFGGRSAL